MQVLGAAAEAEAEVDDRPAAPPRWDGTGDPTPTPHADAVVVTPKGHVHWAWLPVFGLIVLVLALLVLGGR